VQLQLLNRREQVHPVHSVLAVACEPVVLYAGEHLSQTLLAGRYLVFMVALLSCITGMGRYSSFRDQVVVLRAHVIECRALAE
jgi:hypothetical protein